MQTALNTTLTTRFATLTGAASALARRAAPLLGAGLVTFASLHLVANYAMPEQAPAALVLASAAPASAAAVAGSGR